MDSLGTSVYVDYDIHPTRFDRLNGLLFYNFLNTTYYKF